MSLQFILGNAGSGKSVTLYQKLIQESVRNPKKKYMIIVPEQFTLQTQKELVSLHPGHSVINIEVLSFDRLAYRVFDEMGTEVRDVLEDTGKNLVLRRVAQEKMEKLSVLRSNMTKPGYISEMKSLISEFKQYDISIHDFEEIMEDISYPSFRAKAEDILVMYRGFQEFMKDKYITTEEILELLIDVVSDSKLVSDAIMVFDGFTGFTPIQNKLLRILMPMVEKMVCTISIDNREDLMSEPYPEELFYMSKKMAQGLIRIAGETSVPIDDPLVHTMEAPIRFKKDGELLHLEENLFRRTYKKYHNPNLDEHEIELYRLSNPRMELSFVAARIQKMIRTGNYHYRDFAIVCANMADYQNYIQDIFRKYQMPIFVDATSEVRFQPSIEFVRSALSMVEDDFSYASVFHFLRCGMSDMSMDEIDRLDNYVRAAGIRGKKRYFNLFTVIPRGYTSEQVAEINQIREGFVKGVKPFCDGLYANASSKRTVLEMSKALYNLLVEYEIEQKLQKMADDFQENGDSVRAKEYQQIYGIIMDLLSKVVTILGDETMTLEEYRGILDAGLEEAKIGVIPPSYDNIIFGDMERTRLEHIKVLFLVGANDGAIPKSVSTCGILSQIDRQKLKDANYELAPTEREKTFMQRFYLYLILTKPSEKLIVTYGRTGNDGASVRRSYLIQTLCNMFPELEVSDLENLAEEDRMASPIPAQEYLADLLRESVESNQEVDATLEKLFGWCKGDDATLAKRLLDSAYFVHQDDRIRKAALRAVTGESVHGSVSRLEKFASCAYAYFLQYGLKLEKRQEHELQNADMGTLYHDALERYSKKLEDSDYTWYNIPEEEVESLLNESVQETFHTMPKAEFFDEAKEAYILSRMRVTLKRTVHVLTKQVRQGRFIPKGFEVKFSDLESLSSLRYELEDGSTLKLNGKIDRIDRFETPEKSYIKIIDYKSGNKKFDYEEMYYGLQMQLILYMSAAMESEHNRTGKSVEPAGLLYYTIDDPVVDLNNEINLQDEELMDRKEQELMLALRGSGLINEDPKIVEALDIEPEPSSKSKVIPVKYKKDLTLSSDGGTLTTRQFELMEQHVKRQIVKAGSEIAAGKIDISPYRKARDNGCTYCEFKDVCGFDRSLPGFAYRDLKKLNKDQIMEKLVEEEQHGRKEMD